MIRLALLLLGPDFIRTRWPLLALVAALWAALGIAILIDSFRGVVWFPTHLLGYLLILEALITLVATNAPTPAAMQKAAQRKRPGEARIWRLPMRRAVGQKDAILCARSVFHCAIRATRDRSIILV